MQTRSGLWYGEDSGTRSRESGPGAGAGVDPSCSSYGRKRDGGGEGWCSRRKRRRVTVRSEAAAAGAGHDYGYSHEEVDFLDELPDDLVLAILCKLSSTASCPADLFSVLITCKRLNALLLDPVVLARASQRALAIRASKWSESAHRFLRMCSEAGNLEACYILGMIHFYCFQNRPGGASLIAKAAMGFHPAALYSLAVIQFNGSGGTKNDKDLRAGVALCARAAFLGNIDALRELGHCLQDGYGVRQNVAEGRKFLVQANARELASVLVATRPPPTTSWRPHLQNQRHPLLSDFGCNVPLPRPHAANQFLVEWFTTCLTSSSCLPKGCSAETLVVAAAAAASGVSDAAGGLRLCSHAGCGRPETRRHEFRRCSVCGAVNYCSRACQALDWKLRHKAECVPMDRWLQVPDAADGVYAAEGNELLAAQDGPAAPAQAPHIHP